MSDWRERCTIGITTRDRAEDLRHTLERQRDISLADVRYIIVDDGSVDPHAIRALAEQFPRCRFVRHEKSAGYVQRRHEMAQICETEFLVSLDDDSYFLAVDDMEEAMTRFDEDAQLGLVSFQVNAWRYKDRPVTRHITQFSDGPLLWFRGCGYVVRVSAFLAVGGFPFILRHGGEESHLMHQFFRAGFGMRHVPSIVVEHRWSPAGRPNHERAFHLFRSQVIVKLLNQPLSMAVAGAVKIAAWGIWTPQGYWCTRFVAAISGVFEGLRRRWRYRQLTWPQYRAIRREFARAEVAELVLTENAGERANVNENGCCT